MKSMQYIVGKYGGNMLMSQNDCLVNLDIILPVPAGSGGLSAPDVGGEVQPV